ncbi:MAG: hypothetical protein ACFFCS_18450 [Candidatus Hodarchaeota archaeon]
MGKKTQKGLVYEGYLFAEDAKSFAKSDAVILDYWNRVKDNLFVLGDVDSQEITFLNRELKIIAEKFKERKLRITIEPVIEYEGGRKGYVPDPSSEYTGFEKFKRVFFKLFRIS